MHPLLRELLDHRLSSGDYVLFGSGPLLARGWIDHVGDIDVVARGHAWEQARALGESRVLPELEIEVVAIGSSITVGTRWAIGQFSADELIDTAETISGIPCARLDHVIATSDSPTAPRTAITSPSSTVISNPARSDPPPASRRDHDLAPASRRDHDLASGPSLLQIRELGHLR
jgi:hypothetical protein